MLSRALRRLKATTRNKTMLPLLAQDPLRKVLGFCAAAEVLQYGGASKKAGETAADDVVWRALASRDFYGKRRSDGGLTLGVCDEENLRYFTTKPFTKLQLVFDAVAQRKEVPASSLCFSLDGSRVRGHLTLEDLDLSAEQHLDCWALTAANAPQDEFVPSAGAAFSAPAQAEAPEDANDADAADVRTPCDRVGACDSWRVAYRRWFAVAARVRFEGQTFDARTWLKVCRAWRDIKATLAGMPESLLSFATDAILASLRPPAAVEHLQKVGPRGLRYAYAIHDGQDLAFDAARRRQDRNAMRNAQHTVFHGLFGGVAAYDYVVCTRFLSIEWAVKCSIAEEAHGGQRRVEDENGVLANVMFAANYDGNWRFMASDGQTGNGAFGEAVFANDGDVLTAATPHEAHDGFAAWFATYASRVRLGAYGVGPIVPDAPEGTLGIVLFPDADAGDDCHVSEAITRGIRVRASAVYLPNSPSGYAYSIRIKRVSDAAPARCQLMTRHWHINDGERSSTVSGEGVVGKFPVLTSEGWRDDSQVADMAHGFGTAVAPGDERTGEFVYQSFSGMTRGPRGGSFRGEMEFFPGEVAAPTGDPFRILCPEFALRKPQFLY